MIIDKPVEGVTLEKRVHPAGRKGSLISLDEVAERSWKARMSPRLRAWVTEELDKAGVSRGTRKQKMQCVLDAVRAKVPYVADPVMGEFMGTPDQILCLDRQNGLCIIGADCDEFSIILIGGALSIGIPAMVVGSSHKHPLDVPTHVFGAFQDEQDEWVRMDGTTHHPVGHVGKHQREWWVEPGDKAKERGEGDFVGMAGDSEVGVSGSRVVSKYDLLYPLFK